MIYVIAVAATLPMCADDQIFVGIISFVKIKRKRSIRCNIFYFFSININDPMGLLRIVALNGFLDKFEFVFFAIAVDIKSVSLACFELDQL